jgi:hypothetical protein
MSRDVHSCTHWLRPSNSPPRMWTRITRALLVSKDRRHLFVTPWLCANKCHCVCMHFIDLILRPSPPSDSSFSLHLTLSCCLRLLMSPCSSCCLLSPRGKIRLIESSTKCRYLKKLTCKGNLRQAFYLSEAPSPPMAPYSPSPYTMYSIRVYSYSILIYTGKGGGRGIELTREKIIGAIVHKVGRIYQHD